MDAIEGLLHGGLGGLLDVTPIFPPAPTPPVVSKDECLVESVEGWRGHKSRLLFIKQCRI